MNSVSFTSASAKVTFNPQPDPPAAKTSTSLWGSASVYDDVDGYPQCGNGRPHWPHLSSLGISSAVGSAAFDVDDIPFCGNGPHGPLPGPLGGGIQVLY